MNEEHCCAEAGEQWHQASKIIAVLRYCRAWGLGCLDPRPGRRCYGGSVIRGLGLFATMMWGTIVLCLFRLLAGWWGLWVGLVGGFGLMEELPNKLGGYLVERELGRGGMGVVYLARDPRLDRPVAIKSLNEELGEHPERLARFEREARTLAAINDPNIAIVYGMDEELGRQLLVMEYVPGQNLADHIRRSGRLDPGEAYAICVQIAAGLESAHELGIVHRDLKPANVRVREDGVVKVLDFGLAKPEQEMRGLLGDDAETLSMAPTAEGRIMGTAGYMSPEQARGKAVDKRADIWAFGAVLFECLAGERAFRGETPMDAIVAILEKDPPWDRLPEGVPAGVIELIRRCLEKDAKKRLRDIGDARIDLESQLHGRARPDPRRFMTGVASGRDGAGAEGSGTRSRSSGLLGTFGSTIQSRLPSSMTSFVGREGDLEKMRGLFEEARLVTLTGSGGCGKSRLAVEFARQCEDLYRDGVWSLDLAAVEDPDLIGTEIVGVFGLPEAGGRAAEDVIEEALADRELILLLDNCEHLGKSVSAVVQRLLRGCGGMRVLATTREPFGIDGEWVYRVGVLGVPGEDISADEIELIRESESVRLFVDRARVVKPGFGLDGTNAGDVAEICRQLDGVPLAIELAAARMKLLRPDQIAERLHDRFKLLRSRTGDPRQQTLLAAIEWSYEQLDEVERAALQRLSVFRGGATLGAAEAVVSGEYPGEGIEDWEVLDVLENLVDKSMVVVEESTGRGVSGEARYRLLESIRQYGHDLLIAAGDGERALDALLGWAARLASRAESQLFGSDQTDWFERLEQEHGNLRAALDFGFENQTPERLLLAQKIGAGGWRCWAACGRIAEARRLLIRLDKSAEGTEPTAAWAQIREGISSIATTTGDLAHAVAYGRAGLELARHNGDERTIGGLLSCLGSACLGDGIPTRARDYYEESLQIRRAMGDRARTAMSLCGLGLCCVQLEEYERGEAYLRDAEQTLRGAGGGLQAAAIHCGFAELAVATGDAEAAGGRLDLATGLLLQTGAMTGVPGLLEQYACVAEMLGNAGKSVRLFLAAEGGRARLACPARPWEEETRRLFRERAESAVDKESMIGFEAEGRKMPLRRALRYAKGEG